MITISYRTIKIGAIFIAILILAAMAIPAGSEITSRSVGVPELKRINPEKFLTPFRANLPEETVLIKVSDIIVLGYDEVEGERYVWAYVFIKNMVELNWTTDELILHLPCLPAQRLFETAYATGSWMNVYAHEIAMPDDLPLNQFLKLYEVTSAMAYPSY